MDAVQGAETFEEGDVRNHPTSNAGYSKVEGGPPGDAETFTIIGDLLRETYAPP